MARFIDWLTTQQNRPDPIGRLSQAAVADRDFPKENDLPFILSYLSQRGANDQLIKTVRKAYSDFEKSIDDFREKELTKASEPEKPARKESKPKPVKEKASAVIEVKEETAPKADKPKFVPEKKARASKKTLALPATDVSKPASASEASPKKRARTKQENAPVTMLAESKKPRAPRTPKTETKPAPKEPKTKAEASPKTETPKKAIAIPAGKAEKAVIPVRLAEHQQKLKDAVLLFDAQFGKGFSAHNPALLVEYAKIMASNEQTGTLRKFLSSLAEAFLKMNPK